MAKITLILCDVHPCNRTAEREFIVNNEKVYVCGENCFLKFWSREYGSWNKSHYMLESSFRAVGEPALKLHDDAARDILSDEFISSALRVVKPN